MGHDDRPRPNYIEIGGTGQRLSNLSDGEKELLEKYGVVFADRYRGRKPAGKRPRPGKLLQSAFNSILEGREYRYRAMNENKIRFVEKTTHCLRPDGVVVTLVPGDVWPADTKNWTVNFAVDGA